MARNPKPTPSRAVKPAPKRSPVEDDEAPSGPLVIKRAEYSPFEFWIEGKTPLIVHAWSEKAKREMLEKQLKVVRPGRETRDPEGDYMSSLYQMGNEGYGFPVTGLKDAICDRAHKDKGIARTDVRTSLWLNHEIVRVGTAHDKAVCHMPLIRIIAERPEMREDMTRIGSGLKKTANLSYRGQFWPWALRLTGRFNKAVLTLESLGYLIEDAGEASGIGEWRITRKGIFGAFQICDGARLDAWRRYANGQGKIPAPPGLSDDWDRLAAD
jgi:hypothetical protein